MSIDLPIVDYPPSTSSSPPTPSHMKPGTVVAVQVRPQHSGGELLKGIRIIFANPDGSAPGNIPYYEYEQTGLSLASGSPYFALVTIPSNIPQNVPLRCYARTQGIVGGVLTWSDYYGGAPQTFVSVNTPPTPSTSYQHYPAAGSTVTVSSGTQVSALMAFSDANNDSIATVNVGIERQTSGSWAAVKEAFISPNAPANGVISWTFPTLTPGIYRWSATATDSADPTVYGPILGPFQFTVVSGTTTPPPAGGGGGGSGGGTGSAGGAPYEDNSYSFTPSGTIASSGSTFTFTATARFKDDDAGSSITAYNYYIEKYANGSWAIDTAAADHSLGITPGVAFNFTGPTLTAGVAYRWAVKVKDNTGVWSPYSGVRSFQAGQAQGANTPPTCTISTPSGTTADLLPTFNGTFSDVGATNNTFAKYMIEVSLLNSPFTVVWTDTIYTSAAEKTSKTFSKIYSGTTLLNSTQYRWRAQVTDDGALSSAFTSYVNFTTPPPAAPTVPSTALSPQGIFATLTPTFTGPFASTIGATMVSAQVIVYANAAGTTVLWDSGTFAATGTTFSRDWGTAGGTPSTPTPLAPNQPIWWKCRTVDSNGQSSGFSALQSAQETGAPTPPTDLWPRSSSIELWPADVQPTIGGTHNEPSLGNARTGTATGTGLGFASAFASGKRVHIPVGFAFGTPGGTWVWSMTTTAEDTHFVSPVTAMQTIVFNAFPGAPTAPVPADAAKVATLTPTLQWTFNKGIDAASPPTTVPNGRCQAFSQIDIQESGVSLPGYPVVTAKIYDDFSGPLTHWTQRTGTWVRSSSPTNHANVSVASLDCIMTQNAFSSSGYQGCYVTYYTEARSGLIFRMTDTQNFWVAYFDGEYLKLNKVSGGVFGPEVAKVVCDVTNARIQHLMVGMIGPAITVYLNGSPMITGVTDRYNSNGTNHGTYVSGSALVQFSDFWFAPLSSQDSSYTVPVGLLQEEHTYTWKVRSHDGYGFGPYS